MEYKIVIGKTAYDLNNAVAEFAKEGWSPVGSHQVVVRHEQNRFAGTQHKDTIYDLEYSQTMTRQNELVSVQVMYYYEDDELSKRVYDIEGMRIEFERLLEQLDQNK